MRPFNARSLALSILLGSHPPELPARSLVSFGKLFGVAGGTMRTALSRMAANGELVANDGRYRLAGELVQRQRAQDAGRNAPADDWDGRWHTIVAATGQRDVTERRRFRSTMANHRFGELRPDIWMRPSNLDAPAARSDWISTTGDLTGVGDVELSRRLWDLGTIAAEAERLRSDLGRLRDEIDWTANSSIVPTFIVSAGVVRFLRNEPMLPRELAPEPWQVGELRGDYDRFEQDFQTLLRRFLRPV